MEAEGSVVAVAITRLAKHGESISLFVRHVNHYFAFYSLYPLIHRIFTTPAQVQVTHGNREGTGRAARGKGGLYWLNPQGDRPWKKLAS